jgi:hypothetical protein
LEDSLF